MVKLANEEIFAPGQSPWSFQIVSRTPSAIWSVPSNYQPILVRCMVGFMYESILISQFPKCISILSHFIKSWNASQACLIVVFCGEHIFQTRKLILQVQRQPLYCNFLPKATRSWEFEKCNVWCRCKLFNSHFMRSPEGSGPQKVTTIPYVFMNFDALVYIMICPVLQAPVDAEQHCTLWHMWHLW